MFTVVQKPEIQYVGQFYVYGSEARQAAPKQAPRKQKFVLPLVRPRQERRIYVDPVALCGMVVAVMMLAALAIGALQIRDSWHEYDAMGRYLATLKAENVTLEKNYRDGFDLEEIRTTALTLGMVPVEEVKVIPVRVSVPEPEKPDTLWEQISWFVKGLFA